MLKCVRKINHEIRHRTFWHSACKVGADSSFILHLSRIVSPPAVRLWGVSNTQTFSEGVLSHNFVTRELMVQESMQPQWTQNPPGLNCIIPEVPPPCHPCTGLRWRGLCSVPAGLRCLHYLSPCSGHRGTLMVPVWWMRMLASEQPVSDGGGFCIPPTPSPCCFHFCLSDTKAEPCSHPDKFMLTT